VNKPHSFPLLGQRIVVVGATGSGKTIMAGRLAEKLGIPHVELDPLFWNKGWEPVPREVFLERIDLALQGSAWTVDGNYSFARSILWGRADTLVWLDFPWWSIFGRLWSRTVRRIRSQEVLWNDNRETFRGQFLSKDSLFLYMFKSQRKHRREYPQVLLEPRYAHLRLVRLTDTRQAEEWLAGVQ
jgi:adenylate kinase family enzyme